MYFDKHKAVKITAVRVGDWVRIKLPKGKVNFSKYGKPVKVIKLFRNAIKTEDYRIWNLNRVAKCKGPEINVMDGKCSQKGEIKNSHSLVNESKESWLTNPDFKEKVVMRKSTRVCKKPSLLKDYIT